MSRPLIALTMGDPAGIGPELCVRVATAPLVVSEARLAIVGSPSVLESTGRDLGVPPPWESGDVSVVDIGDPAHPIAMGQACAEAGRLSAAALERAIAMALDGQVDAICTAPISKDAWHRAGVGFPGHTEYLADRTGTTDFGLMLVQDSWRVLHVSTHVSLRRAIEMVSRERIVMMLGLFDDALRGLGCPAPKIGVAGLNPHAGEGGMFGDEEDTTIAPAIAQARAAGIDALGPIPPDTVFARSRAGEYDGALAMYHDQGHVAVKTLAFEPGPTGGWSAVRGVNVTVGLPIVRTSVDHGVAFDISGQGVARPESLTEALLLAARMAKHRAAADGSGASA